MVRKHRVDYPGAWHHVMNRALAHRSAFESEEDMRSFLLQVVKQCRLGRLEVHAYCVMSTHFHLLIRSPKAELSLAMQCIENSYTRGFNRRRDRDGPLFRGRFNSRCVETDFYLRNLFSYIAANPVTAGIVERPEDYPYSSAYHWAKGQPPAWLAQTFVRQHIGIHTASGKSALGKSYVNAFGRGLTDGQREWVSARVEGHHREEDPFKNLFEAAPTHVREWMVERARVADGSQPGLQVVSAESALSTLAAFEEEPVTNLENPRRLYEAMLLRDVCACSYRQMAARMGVSDKTAIRRYQRHADAIEKDSGYAAGAVELVTRAVSEFADSWSGK